MKKIVLGGLLAIVLVVVACFGMTKHFSVRRDLRKAGENTEATQVYEEWKEEQKKQVADKGNSEKDASGDLNQAKEESSTELSQEGNTSSDVADAGVPISAGNGAASYGGSGYYGALQVIGTQLCGADGQAVQLRGISTHGLAWYPEYVTYDAISYMHEAWGINVLRLAMYTTSYGGYCVSETDTQKKLLDLIDTGVSAATDNHMYVIIDWHILEDGNPLTYISRSEEFFDQMSKKYADNDHVLYEICNEPNGGTSWEQIKKYADQIIPVIRKNDPDAIIIVGTPTWSQDVDVAAQNPVSDSKNVMYALHFYAATHKANLREKAQRALNAGLPIFVTEFSICDASGNGANDIYEANLWMDFMNENGISCVEWNLSNKAESSALIASSCNKKTGWERSDLSESGQWMLDHLAGVVTEILPVQNSNKKAATVEKSDASDATQNESGQNAGSQVAQNAGNDWSVQTMSSANKLSAPVTTQEGIAVNGGNSWESGGKTCTQYGVSLSNQAGGDSSSWKLTIVYDQDIALQSGWCGSYAVSANTLTVEPADYNNEVIDGSSISNLGFILESVSAPKVQSATITWQ